MTNLKTIHIAEGTKKLSGFKCSDHGESDEEETDSYDYTTDDTDSESDKKIDPFYYMADTLDKANFEFNPFADFIVNVKNNLTFTIINLFKVPCTFAHYVRYVHIGK